MGGPGGPGGGQLRPSSEGQGGGQEAHQQAGQRPTGWMPGRGPVSPEAARCASMGGPGGPGGGQLRPSSGGQGGGQDAHQQAGQRPTGWMPGVVVLCPS